MGGIVVHAHLGQAVASVLASGEHHAPVERTAGGQADGVDVHAVVVEHPTGFHGSGLMVEADVVHVEAVVVAVDATVLRVSPLEGVCAFGDGELALGPVAGTSVAAHLLAVDEEVAVVPVLLAADLAEEAHLAVAGDVDRNGHVAGDVGHASAAALHAVLAFIRVGGEDSWHRFANRIG